MQNNLYNIEYEKTILASIIFEPKKVEECQAVGLRAIDFYLPNFQDTYEVILYLFENKIVGEEVIKQELGSKFDEKAMLEILSTNPVNDLSYYIQKTKEAFQLRAAELLATKIKTSVRDNQNYNEVLKVLNEGISNLEQDNSQLINIKNITDIKPKEAEFICKSWLPFPVRAVSLVTAGGGVGKSFLLLQAALRMIKEDKLKVFMWLSEDPVELSKFRYQLIVDKVFNSGNENYKDMLDIAGSDSETIHFLEEDRNRVSVSGLFYQFKAMLRDYDVIILDPLIAMFGGDENNNAHAKKFINLFSRWATLENKTIIFIHHGTKNTAQSRGASAFVDAVRLVYQLEVVKNKEDEQIEDHMRLITLTKDNNGAKKYLGDTQVKRQVFPEIKKIGLSLEIDI